MHSNFEMVEERNKNPKLIVFDWNYSIFSCSAIHDFLSIIETCQSLIVSKPPQTFQFLADALTCDFRTLLLFCALKTSYYSSFICACETNHVYKVAVSTVKRMISYKTSAFSRAAMHRVSRQQPVDASQNRVVQSSTHKMQTSNNADEMVSSHAPHTHIVFKYYRQTSHQRTYTYVRRTVSFRSEEWNAIKGNED